MIGKALHSPFLFAVALLALASTATTQGFQDPSASDYSSEYSYDNGYIRAAEGDVSLQRAQNPEPEPGDINVPVLPGDRIWTTASSFAEIRLADGTQVRLGDDTKVDFMAFGAEPNLRLWNGSVIVTVGESSRVRVDTPSGSVYQQSPGSHRVDVRDGTTTHVTVLQGTAELGSDRSSVIIGAGQKSSLVAGAEPEDPVAVDTSSASLSSPGSLNPGSLDEDELDRWSRERDLSQPRRREVPLTQASGEVHHYVDDLEDHGSWSDDEDYGPVWYPSVGTDWAPYRDGRWCYTSYGYTWVSYEPWGWAPYHYGRWGYNPRGWYWIPGRYWSPAWVSFAVGPAWIGWSPLGYHGGAVFGYDYVYYGSGRYPHANNRRYYRGGKAVPRHVYDHGAGWNFSDKDHFRRGGKARLRVDDVRSSSARARIANQAAVLDHDLTPRGMSVLNSRAPRRLPFASQAGGTTTGRARSRVSPSSEAARSQTGFGSTRDGYRASSVSRTRGRAEATGTSRIFRSDDATRDSRAETRRGVATEELRSGSRVFRAQERSGAESQDRATGTSGSVRRRTIPNRTRPERTSPERSELSSSGRAEAQPRTERRTRGQDYFESSSRRESVTRSTRSPARTRSRSSSGAGARSQERASPSPSPSPSHVAPSRSRGSRSTARPPSRSSGASGARSSSGRSRSSGATRSGRARGRKR